MQIIGERVLNVKMGILLSLKGQLNVRFVQKTLILITFQGSLLAKHVLKEKNLYLVASVKQLFH